MPFTPFHIRCTTCEAKLAVRNAALLGQVLACPKCGSMVHITMPENQTATNTQKPDEPNSDSADSSSGIIPPAPPITPIAVAPPVLDPATVHIEIGNTPEENPFIGQNPQRDTGRKARIILVVTLVSIALLLGIACIVVLNRPAPEETDTTPKIQVPPAVVEPVEPPVGPQPDEEPAGQETTDDPGPEPELETTEPEVESKEEETQPAEVEKQPDDTNAVEPAFVPQPIQDREEIDVNARLQFAFSGMKAEQTTLYDAATKLADMAGVPLTWDLPGMRLFDIPLDQPIRLDFGETTIGEALATLLAQQRLATLVEHGQIFIYPIDAADPTLKEVRYDITDIIRSSVTPDAANVSDSITTAVLVDMIPRMIAPFSWQMPEKQATEEVGSITAEGTVLVVKQTEINQKEVFRFLEMIRSARKIPLVSITTKGAQDAERILRELFSEQICSETLAQPLTLHYNSPTPLVEIFKTLTPAMKIRFFVNHRVLNESQCPLSELRGTVHVENGTAREALRQLLHSVDQLELTYRIVDHDAIEITTWDATLLPEYATLESHFYGTKLRSQTEQTADDMLQMLKNTVEPDSWAEATFGGGTVLLDRESETFFIRQSQPIQRVIREWLGG